MTIASWFAARSWRLPPRTASKVRVNRNVAVPMRDGVVLIGDHWRAENSSGLPLVLIRCPYGRGSGFAMTARLFAERGFQVFVQSCRGTFGSGGVFDPVRQEQDDGLDTLDWLERQPWCGDKIFTFGMSYLGFVQWAIARPAGTRVAGMTLQFTLANFRNEVLPHGGCSLEGALGWATMMAKLVSSHSGLVMLLAMLRRTDPNVYMQLPLRGADRRAVGQDVPWWQDWMTHCDQADPWWDAIDFSKFLDEVQAPASLIAGWHDLFLPWQVKDFEVLQAAGRDAWLTIGPWHHTAQAGGAEAVRQGLDMFAALAACRPAHAGRDRVRVYVMGAEEWRGFDAWPPPNACPELLFLGDGGDLSMAPAAKGGSAHFVFDPADPTPSLHPPSPFAGPAKEREMKALEVRQDTIVFTGPPLECDTDVIGPVVAELHFRADTAHSDIYACVCEVDERGRSLKVCDGYLRLWPDRHPEDGQGVRTAVIECGPTAFRFRRGRRLRLVVAGGAHPRFARNLGTGASLASGVAMARQGKEILFGGSYPSSLRILVQG